MKAAVEVVEVVGSCIGGLNMVSFNNCDWSVISSSAEETNKIQKITYSIYFLLPRTNKQISQYFLNPLSSGKSEQHGINKLWHP